uniref:Uncharacterized protein n=1 Tax=Rhizophora mucronata TaxID=61149 RepID=A0A2P2IYT0_RHIMU
MLNSQESRVERNCKRRIQTSKTGSKNKAKLTQYLYVVLASLSI